MSSITASLTTARVAPATRAASKGKRATKAAAVSEKKAGASQEEANDVFGVARKAATAALAMVALLRLRRMATRTAAARHGCNAIVA